MRALGRLFRRLTIGLGALIVALYFSGEWLISNWPYPACSEWPKSRIANDQGDAAIIAVHGCMLGLVNRQYLVRVRPAGSSAAKLVARFKPREWPSLHWLADHRLQADLGQVISFSPQIDHVGPVDVTFSYSGADPSLD